MTSKCLLSRRNRGVLAGHGKFEVIFFLKQRNIDEKVINSLKRRLSAEDKKQLISDIRYASAWIEKVVRRLQE